MAGPARVLVVTGHPDDMEILCGGTLLRYREQGAEVTVCHSCNGDLGHMVIMPEPLAELRWKEADEAAKIGGLHHETLGYHDLGITETPEKIARLAGIIRKSRPTVIITHDPNDYMADHSDVPHLVLKASFVATLPHAEGVEGEVYPVVTPVYFMDTIMGVGFVPEDYVDITGVIDTKERMLRAHRSQVDWLRDHDNIDVVDNMRVCARYRGLQCGVKFAECFRRNRQWPRVTPERLLP